jgi:perosamine synthetase
MPTTLDNAQLAIHGGKAVRSTLLPYGHQTIEEDDIAAVTDVLRSDWLTTGPKVSEFERAFADFTGAREAVAVSNGTAALHAAVAALRIEPGDEVIVTPLTFAASANCVVYQGGTPVFVDVEPDTLLLDPSLVERAITKRTKAIVAVDYAGQPADYDSLGQLAERHGLAVIGDAAHSLGGEFHGRKVGTLAKLTTFSLHPVKLMTTGEGGMITTDDPVLAGWMRTFRSHGITSDHRQREAEGSWFYEMTDLGYNYRITDFQCALGLSQLQKLGEWLERRSQIAALYDRAFESVAAIRPLSVKPHVKHGYHLYVVRVVTSKVSATRAEIFSALRAENIGVNVHYVPVHLHPFYRRQYRTAPGQCPVAEAAYEELITLPIFPGMSDEDAADVISAVRKVIDHYSV